MDWSWAVGGVTSEVPRTTGPECENYLTNRRRWLEALFISLGCLWIIRLSIKRLKPIYIPNAKQLSRSHSTVRLLLMLIMTFIFGMEMGFKFANKSVIFVLNPCHIQTLVQIYLLAAKPSKTSIALFRIQMNNLNGPLLAFLFPEVECRTLPFEQAAYWLQHAMLYIIPIYIIRSDAYPIENIYDFNWVTIGVMIMLLYHFVILNAISIFSGINLNHMLCAAETDPFQGQNYRIAATIHESILCPILNKGTVLIFSNNLNLHTKSFMQQYLFRINAINNHDNTNDKDNIKTFIDKFHYNSHQKLTKPMKTLQRASSSSMPTPTATPLCNVTEGNSTKIDNIIKCTKCKQLSTLYNENEYKFDYTTISDTDNNVRDDHQKAQSQQCENLMDAHITAAYTITTTTKID